MKYTLRCPDCNGRGWFDVIEGDIYKGKETCVKCNGNTEIEMDLDESTICDILDELRAEKHPSLMSRV